jgi:GNAT superfamily N-acetyltransferase
MKIRDVDFDNPAELKSVAKIYVSVPSHWDSKYSFSEQDTQNYYEWLLAKKNCLKCLIVTTDSQIVGIHILLNEPSSATCSIKTLWLDEKFRKRGVGSRLKKIGEEWAVSVGAKKIITHVMSDNPMMFEINKKKGFVLTKFEMEKALSR